MDRGHVPLWTISLTLEPADCVLYFKTKMAENIKTMSGRDDDRPPNYDIVIQCQSVWTCFFTP